MADRALDRSIARFALPALGALAAEPLYVLVDTAIVGHLGRSQLAAIGAATAILGTVFGLCNVLEYATTAHVGRADSGGERGVADRIGVQGLVLAALIGVVVAAVVALLAGPLVALVGVHGVTARRAVTYVRIAVVGQPFALVALAGEGYLRGLTQLLRPFAILITGNLLNVGLELWFVYGLHLGLRGSAWGTVIAQAVMGLAFVAFVLRASRASSVRVRIADLRALFAVSLTLAVRSGALLGCFAVGSAVAGRIGTAALAAHQIAFQAWLFLAYVLDALAIAAQVLVSRALGVGDAAHARVVARRTIELSVALGVIIALALIGGANAIPRLFTHDPATLRQATRVWPIVVLMQPLTAAVFALDGILIGAADARYLMWSMLVAACCFVPLAILVVLLGGGLVGLWFAILALILVRLATLGRRLRSGRWAAVGASAPAY